MGSVSRPTFSRSWSVHPASSVTECSAKKSRVVRLRVISHVACLMPFSQMSMDTLGSSGQAQPGQSKPPSSWFIRNTVRAPSTGSRSLASTSVTEIAAPYPAAGWW